jgi:hypothetical protein
MENTGNTQASSAGALDRNEGRTREERRTDHNNRLWLKDESSGTPH